MYDFYEGFNIIISLLYISYTSLEVIRQNQHIVSTPILIYLFETELLLAWNPLS